MIKKAARYPINSVTENIAWRVNINIQISIYVVINMQTKFMWCVNFTHWFDILSSKYLVSGFIRPNNTRYPFTICLLYPTRFSIIHTWSCILLKFIRVKYRMTYYIRSIFIPKKLRGMLTLHVQTRKMAYTQTDEQKLPIMYSIK